jgi:DNA polymerase-3 subunit epsilon
MTLALTRPLASLDIESTGVDPVNDRIIQFGVVVLHPNGQRVEFEKLFNPGIPIPAEATEIHGITDEMVKLAPPFAEFAAQLHAGLRGKDLLGYNLRSLDLPMLDEEFRRCGLSLDLEGVTVVDVQGIFFKKEPRDLSAAVCKFTNHSHEGAHGALADSVATLEVLMGMRSAWPIDVGTMDLAALAAFGQRQENIADLAGKLYRDADGDVCFGFGKPKGEKVRNNPGFARWVLGKDFPGSTKDALRAELERISKAPPSGTFADALKGALNG